jgi:hypothetical protein
VESGSDKVKREDFMDCLKRKKSNSCKKRWSTLLLTLILLSITFLSCLAGESRFKPGLVGIYFSEPNLTSIKAVTFLAALEQNWDERVDFETGSSGVWDGYLTGPIDGDVIIHLETNKKVVLEIDGKHRIEANKDQMSTRLKIQMTKGQLYPVCVSFYNAGKRTDYGFFNIKWQLPKGSITSIPASHITHSEANLKELDWIPDLEPASQDKGQFLTVPGKHVIVSHEPERFAAWPANTGIWSWGDEILVGFLRAYYKENKFHHSIDRTKPMKFVLARSLDGGESWSLEDPDNFAGDGTDYVTLRKKIDFSHPDFALQVSEAGFFTSIDRGKTWKGPFLFTDFGLGKLTSRTDYLINSKNDVHIFLSVKDNSVKATLQDRAFCARTTDGGKSFEFLSWMAQMDSIRSVMPATVRLSDTHLISALRRRYDPPLELKKTLPKNYITVHESHDNGKSWTFLHKIAETDRGIRNGNPPSMVILDDGRICVMYGYRNRPYSIRARISSDKGITWSKQVLLRDDARKFDIGYTRSIVRTDGKIVTVYYYTTDEKKEMHIAATIWNADDVTEFIP